jgi:hypothetical protein
MRLIDADKLKFPNIAIFDMKLHGVTVPMVRLIDLQMLMPTVDAVPLDKLCEWLDYHVGKPLDCVGEQCIKCKFGVTDSGNGNCWKAMLTKWMEGLDDHR